MEVKEIRKQTGMSQSEFAKRFNIPVGTLAHWEQGVRTPPDYVIGMIKEILNINYDDGE